MLTKNCKVILKHITSLPGSNRFASLQITDLAKETRLSFEETLSACKELNKDGLAELKILHLRNGQEIPEAISLTEAGLNYKALLWAQRAAYIADKWTDIIATVIAVISLIVSIHTALSN